ATDRIGRFRGMPPCFRGSHPQTDLQRVLSLGNIAMNRLAVLFVLLVPAIASGQPARRAMTVDDLFRFKRLADPQMSPDGKWIVYAVGTVDMTANKVVYNLWLASTEK